jgi:hypothetical protein
MHITNAREHTDPDISCKFDGSTNLIHVGIAIEYEVTPTTIEYILKYRVGLIMVLDQMPAYFKPNIPPATTIEESFRQAIQSLQLTSDIDTGKISEHAVIKSDNEYRVIEKFPCEIMVYGEIDMPHVYVFCDPVDDTKRGKSIDEMLNAISNISLTEAEAIPVLPKLSFTRKPDGTKLKVAMFMRYKDNPKADVHLHAICQMVVAMFKSYYDMMYHGFTRDHPDPKWEQFYLDLTTIVPATLKNKLLELSAAPCIPTHVEYQCPHEI